MEINQMTNQMKNLEKQLKQQLLFLDEDSIEYKSVKQTLKNGKRIDKLEEQIEKLKREMVLLEQQADENIEIFNELFEKSLELSEENEKLDSMVYHASKYIEALEEENSELKEGLSEGIDVVRNLVEYTQKLENESKTKTFNINLN